MIIDYSLIQKFKIFHQLILAINNKISFNAMRLEAVQRISSDVIVVVEVLKKTLNAKLVIR